VEGEQPSYAQSMTLQRLSTLDRIAIQISFLRS
jgi:hypothetical protein